MNSFRLRGSGRADRIRKASAQRRTILPNSHERVHLVLGIDRVDRVAGKALMKHFLREDVIEHCWHRVLVSLVTESFPASSPLGRRE